MKTLPAALAGTAILMLAACSSPAAAPAAGTASQTAVAAPAATVKPLSPLKLGHFASTTDGELASAICKSWSGLRAEYVSKVDAGTDPFDLNQWFSGAAWAKVQDDSGKLGNDPAYSNLETSLGAAITGDLASTGTATELDKACSAAD